MNKFSTKIVVAIAIGILVIGIAGIGITIFASGYIKTENNFSAYPTQVVSGSSTTLTWESTKASSCEASGGWSGKKEANGSEKTTINEATSYTLTCYNSRGIPTISSLAVTVKPKAQILSFTIIPDNDVVSGASAVASWTTVNAGRCEAAGAWKGSKAVNGKENIYPTRGIFPLLPVVDYQLNCYGNSGDSADRDSRHVEIKFLSISSFFGKNSTNTIKTGIVASVDSNAKSFVFVPDGTSSKITVYYDQDTKYFLCDITVLSNEIVVGKKYTVALLNDNSTGSLKYRLSAIDDLSGCSKQGDSGTEYRSLFVGNKVAVATIIPNQSYYRTLVSGYERIYVGYQAVSASNGLETYNGPLDYKKDNVKFFVCGKTSQPFTPQLGMRYKIAISYSGSSVKPETLYAVDAVEGCNPTMPLMIDSCNAITCISTWGYWDREMDK